MSFDYLLNFVEAVMKHDISRPQSTASMSKEPLAILAF